MSDSFLSKLKAGTNNRKMIRFPGTDQEIQLRIISDAQYQQARIETERHFQKLKVEPSMTLADAFEAEETTQVLYRALQTKDEKPLANTVDEFREIIKCPEKDFLANEYLEFERECSPNPEKLFENEFDSLISDIKKKPETVGKILS